MDFTRLFDILDYRQQRFGKHPALAQPLGNEQWQHWMPAQIWHESQCLAAGLLQLGFQKGDRVGIFTHCGSPQWCIADAAMMQIGVQPVPIHATSRTDEIEHIFQDAGLRACFISHSDMLGRLSKANCTWQFIFSFEKISAPLSQISEKTRLMAWHEVCCEPAAEDIARLDECRRQISENDTATILYTSGTTGMPKGVMLSHANIVSNVKSVLAIVPLHPGMVCLSFLPMSHIFERMVVFGYLAAGAEVYFSDDIQLLPETLKTVRPQFFTAVPRIIERMAEKLLAHRDGLGIFQQKIFDWAIRLGERYPYAGAYSMPLDYRLKLWLARLLVFRKFKKALGGRIQYVAVGAAALQPRLGRLLAAAGLDIREGYGLTETSPVIAFNRFEPGGVHFGTVGIPIPSLEVRIAAPRETGADGEIEVRGPSVMQGYLNLPQETAARFTPDGWFRTGDLGKFEHKRFLKITGRADEIFKTTTGKFVAPQFVEQQLLRSPYVGQCMVLGANQTFVGALIVPNFEHLENWCKLNQVHWTAPQFMILNPKVEKFFQQEIERINDAYLSPVERVRAFKLLHENWTADNGLLTPTLKLKRANIAAQFSKIITDLFDKKVKVD